MNKLPPPSEIYIYHKIWLDSSNYYTEHRPAFEKVPESKSNDFKIPLEDFAPRGGGSSGLRIVDTNILSSAKDGDPRALAFLRGGTNLIIPEVGREFLENYGEPGRTQRTEWLQRYAHDLRLLRIPQESMTLLRRRIEYQDVARAASGASQRKVHTDDALAGISAATNIPVVTRDRKLIEGFDRTKSIYKPTLLSLRQSSSSSRRPPPRAMRLKGK